MKGLTGAFFVCAASKGLSGKVGLGKSGGKCQEAKGTRRTYHTSIVAHEVLGVKENRRKSAIRGVPKWELATRQNPKSGFLPTGAGPDRKDRERPVTTKDYGLTGGFSWGLSEGASGFGLGGACGGG